MNTPPPITWYRFEDGQVKTHVYGCGRCSWKRVYPEGNAQHAELGGEALRLHVKVCHPNDKYLPPASVTTAAERKFLEAITSAVEKARLGGVHPGDVMAVLAACFTAAARGSGLTLRNANDIIAAWWGDN